MKKQNIGLLSLILLVGVAFVYFFSSGKENSLNGVFVGIAAIVSRAVYSFIRYRQRKQAE